MEVTQIPTLVQKSAEMATITIALVHYAMTEMFLTMMDAAKIVRCRMVSILKKHMLILSHKNSMKHVMV